MDKKFYTEQYKNYYSLPKKERQRIAIEIADVRKQMFYDLVEQNRRIIAHNERVLEESVNYEPEYIEEHNIVFFDFEHPIISMFVNWFANKE